ncbi:hypothetical protein WJS89_10660 [Sphingomicrobium sp. XHP0235]|uniref:hypothetical protein n=1 Tax=Sphingomicrobium aquimarinum TaxID=3133971 RepID=UPI0031FEBBDE
MPSAEKVNCDKCNGTGFLDYRGFSMDACVWCSGTGTIEQSSKVDDLADSVISAANAAGPTLRLEQHDAIRNAVASSHGRSGKSLDSLGADGQEVATVIKSLTVQTEDRLEELRQWADDNCPEGVAGAPDNVRWLLSYAEDVATTDLRKRMSDAVTLLYTHGVITDKMRAHARRNL